ncbi:MAG TPA: ribosome biogenesis GTP-binding protein YihA/YsxC [Rhabdochlamydiaceae bacterium]|jgi:GTP-binding protein|nr:ribosome biogenesis GTP-binding protein YihA/YsxC [Rhabdochlamydiaceae bacterium]
MKKCPFNTATFLLSTLDEVPPFMDKDRKVLPEIALIGRSNVGKSSLINHLLRRKNLAKVSATPGKTQTINYFNVDNQLIIVDLPGYGYAARSHEMQLLWSGSIDRYLNKRSSLSLILLLIDSRRNPTGEDLATLEWARHHKKPLLLILTKSDTLSERERQNTLKNALLELPAKHTLFYSIKDPRSRQNLITTINKLMHGLAQ